MLPRGVGFGAPSAGRGIGVAKGMMAELLAVGTLCEKVELQVAFNPEGFGKGAKARLGCKVLGFGASGDDSDRGGGLPNSFVISGEPSWLFGKSQASVVSGELLADVS